MKNLWIVGVMVLSGCRAQMFSYGYRDGYSDALKSKKSVYVDGYEKGQVDGNWQEKFQKLEKRFNETIQKSLEKK